MDPIDLRIKNSAREGTRRVFGTLMPKVGFVEVLEAAKNHLEKSLKAWAA